MRPNSVIALSVPDVTADTVGDAILANQIMYSSIQAVAAGSSPKGTVTLQASNDLPAAITWTDIPNATVAVSGVKSYLSSPNQLCYQWIRAIWTKDGSAPGTGTVTVDLSTQGF